MENTEGTARGGFEVTLTGRQLPALYDQDGLSQMGIDKTFSGDIEAQSRGEMLAIQGAIDGSAGYVAIEIIEGSVHGKGGSFVLQHSSIMDRGVMVQGLRVVPDSGTGELEGLVGSMKIDVSAAGKHAYTFEYTIGD